MIEKDKHYVEIAHKKYKYRCIKEFMTYTKVRGYSYDHKYFRLYSDGVLLIKKDYACDGASGPTIDGDTNMQAAFMHDVLYQMLRLKLLGDTKKLFNFHRKLADLSFYNQLKRDGMSFFRRQYFYYGVRLFGRSSALPSN